MSVFELLRRIVGTATDELFLTIAFLRGTRTNDKFERRKRQG
jgi:hypothetical protein